MAELWVRYKNGDTDEWRLTDAFVQDKPLEDFVRDVIHASYTHDVMSFPVVPDDDGAPGSDFGFVSVRLDDLSAWRVNGLVNLAKAAALWAELGGSSDSE